MFRYTQHTESGNKKLETDLGHVFTASCLLVFATKRSS
jgi:hypothetical protein